ncbi:MAG: glycosyltransferase [Gammaproteobacteria bacterium]
MPEPIKIAKVSLIMIVRNEEHNLPICLESVRGLFEEIVIVDTGSTDRTKKIAQQFGAKIIDFIWVDDFAAARNVSLANATGDYVFWMDADDVFDPPERNKLESLLKILRSNQKNAYVVRCASDPDRINNSGHIVVDHIRLFPRMDNIRWVYKVHEQILPALNAAHIPILWTDITVRHTGYVNASAKAMKRQRDLNILLKELDSCPNDAFLLFNLGMISFERQQWQEALNYFLKSLSNISNAESMDSLRRKLFGMTAWAYQILGNLQDSLRICNQGLSVDPQDAELLFRKAIAYRYLGSTLEAETCLNKILNLKRPDKFCSIDQGIYGHLTRRNLAIIATERGDHAEARNQWKAILKECPGDPDAMRNMSEVV